MSKVRRRISLFMESLGGGGAERVMLNLAQAFSRLEHHVDLVVASTKGPVLLASSGVGQVGGPWNHQDHCGHPPARPLLAP